MPNIVDSLKDFALPSRGLFPCDTVSMVKASAVALDREWDKLTVHEKVAASRHVVARAQEKGIETGVYKIARYTGKKLSENFSACLGLRKEACYWDPKACDQLNRLQKLADVCLKQDPDVVGELLEKLAVEVEAFDRHWSLMAHWAEGAVPCPVATVFDAEPQGPKTVSVGDRAVSAGDLGRLDKVAAAKYLSPEAIKAAESFELFAQADDVTQAALCSFIPQGAK